MNVNVPSSQWSVASDQQGCKVLFEYFTGVELIN